MKYNSILLFIPIIIFGEQFEEALYHKDYLIIRGYINQLPNTDKEMRINIHDSKYGGNTEEWYTLWSLGQSFSDNICNDKHSETGCIQSSISKLTLDILGFYWHINAKSLGGVIISGTMYDGEVGSSSLTLSSLSYIKYINQFGAGPYFRIDMGYAESIFNSNESKPDLYQGTGVLVGGGYSFDFKDFRLLVGLNHNSSSVDSEKYGYTNLLISGLF